MASSTMESKSSPKSSPNSLPIRFIQRAKELGFTLSEIKELLSAWCTRRNVRQLRILMVADARQLRVLTYDPDLRRLDANPR